jgi:WD repeat-containing protein 26
MIPEHRLAVLLDEVKQGWIRDCLYHNTEQSPSLYVDHGCDRDEFPMQERMVLNEHTDEVWYLAFSNNGHFLATASRDTYVNIYDVRSRFTIVRTLAHDEAGVCYVAWSPDDEKLISCTREPDNHLRVWNAAVRSFFGNYWRPS